MKKHLPAVLLLVILSSFLLTGCQNCPPCPPNTTTIKPVDNGSKKTLATADCSFNPAGVTIPLTSIADLHFCVDESAGVIKICSATVCKQIIPVDSPRKWYAEPGAGGIINFIDAPDNSYSPSESYPHFRFPFNGNKCDLELYATNNGNNCPFVLIGKDDIRNDNVDICEEYDFNIYNTSGNSKFVQVKVKGPAPHKLYMKYSLYNTNDKPNDCTLRCPNNGFCKIGITENTSNCRVQCQ